MKENRRNHKQIANSQRFGSGTCENAFGPDYVENVKNVKNVEAGKVERCEDGKCVRMALPHIILQFQLSTTCPGGPDSKRSPVLATGPKPWPNSNIFPLAAPCLVSAWSKNSHVSLHLRHSGSCGKCAWNLSSTRNQPRRLKPKPKPEPELEPNPNPKPNQNPNIAKNITSFWVVSSFVAFFYFILFYFLGLLEHVPM